MAKCDIAIAFDRPDRRYFGGEQVTGTVTIAVNQDVNCRGIKIERLWKTHGRGNTFRPDPSLLSEEQGRPLHAGQRDTFPFEFTAPATPYTYHGKFLNVDHYVRVRVDVPWGFAGPRGDGVGCRLPRASRTRV